MNARSNAVAIQEKQIEESTQRAAAAKPRANALQLMASRLHIEPGRLASVLKNTVFKNANENDFAALLIVANEYDLNPLTKEIFAFPAKGGGIMPMVSYDGWIKIVNRHPDYDGYEHNEIFVGEEFQGVESIFYRKSLSRPIKKTVYLEEFKMNTDPWKIKPRHMTQIRSYCQAARMSFGITGLFIEGEEIEFGDAAPEPIQQARVPKDKELKRLEAEAANADQDTGEIMDEQPLTEDQQREIAEQLDAQQSAAENGLSDGGDEPAEAEEATDDTPAWRATYDQIDALISAAKTEADWKKADNLFQKHSVALPDAERERIDAALKRVLKRIRDGK